MSANRRAKNNAVYGYNASHEPASMTDEEAYVLLAINGMLVKGLC